MLENNKPDIFYDEILMPFKGKLELGLFQKKYQDLYLIDCSFNMENTLPKIN